MGSSGSVLEKKRLNMNLHYFAVLLLLVLTVNGTPKPDPKASPKAAPKPIPKAAPKPNPKAAPKPKPNPKADPKAKAQMAIIINNKKHGGNMGMPKMEGREMEFFDEGYDYAGFGDDYKGAYGDDYTDDYGDYASYDNGHGTDYQRESLTDYQYRA